MKVSETKYYCDKCGEEMTEYMYEYKAPKIVIRVEYPIQRELNKAIVEIEVKLCNSCSEKVGIKIETENYNTVTAKQPLRQLIEKCKNTIIDMVKFKVE